MLKMSEDSKAFLAKNLSNVVDSNNTNIILDALSDWIDLNGFSKDSLYNENGKVAQAVYDNIYYSN